MNGLNWPKPNLNRENWSLKILNQDPKNSIHLIHPSFKIFKIFTFVYHPYPSAAGAQRLPRTEDVSPNGQSDCHTSKHTADALRQPPIITPTSSPATRVSLPGPRTKARCIKNPDFSLSTVSHPRPRAPRAKPKQAKKHDSIQWANGFAKARRGAMDRADGSPSFLFYTPTRVKFGRFRSFGSRSQPAKPRPRIYFLQCRERGSNAYVW
ncbi:hypothetical protein HRG_012812 [Hirsutella rhossiliensis]